MLVDDTGKGVLVTFEDGYCYYETLTGGLRATDCEACGQTTYEAERRQRQEEKDPPYVLCSRCLREFWFPEEGRLGQVR